MTLARVKCTLFRACARVSLCKAAVCQFLRVKNGEIPPLLLAAFGALLAALILFLLYLVYVYYVNCYRGGGAGEGKGDSGEWVPPLPPPLYRSSVKVEQCPEEGLIGGLFGGTYAVPQSPEEKEAECRKRLSNLLNVSQKCATMKRLQQWFRDENYTSSRVQLKSNNSSPWVQSKKSHLDLTRPNTSGVTKAAFNFPSRNCRPCSARNHFQTPECNEEKSVLINVVDYK
ncbi:hypothetical protein M8J77_023820 [Diaphorina citri]|nr:hypothetical protein M8J77_023820 [Diaphorina citri]